MADYKNKPREELVKLLEERDKADKAREEAESKAEENVLLEKQRLEILIAQKKALGEVYEAKQLELKLLEKLEDLDDAAFIRDQRMLDLVKELQEAKNESEEKSVEQKIKALASQLQLNDAILIQVAHLQKNTKGVNKLTKAQEEAKESMKGTFEGIATKIGLNSAAYNRLSDGVTKFNKLVKENPKLAKQAIKETFSLQKMGGALFMQMFESTMELARATDKATAAFAANTGAGRVMTEQIYEMTAENRNLGVSAESAGKAYQDLFEGFSGFMQLSKQAQKDLGATVAGLARLGIDGGVASKTLVLFNKNMGMSLKDSQKLTKQLAVMGTKIGISSKKMVSGFVEASKSLAVYGKDAVKVFSDLAAQARAANVETSTLLGIAGQFDTFSGAADAAGKLNSILGSQISATEMLTMKENERIEMLIRSMQAQGRSFKDMDRFSQKAVAAAAGISDISEAQRIFGMSVSEYRKGLIPDPKEEEFNQRLKDTMDIMEKLKKLGQQFAITFTPFLDTIASAVQGMLDLNQASNGYLIPTLSVILGTLVFLPKIVGVFTTFMGLFSSEKVAKKAGKGITAFAKGLGKAAKHFLKGSLGLLAVGAALLIFAAGFVLLASGFGGDLSFATAFGFLSGIGLGLVVLAVGLAAVGAIATAGGGLGFAAIIAGAASMAIALAMIGKAADNLKDNEALSGLASVIGGFGTFMVNFKVGALDEAENFMNSLQTLDADIFPVIGDLALIATGKTTQSVTQSTVGYNFNTFQAKFENIFKPNVVVEISGEAIDSRIKQISTDVAGRSTD